MSSIHTDLFSATLSPTSATFKLADIDLHYTSFSPNHVIKKSRELFGLESYRCPITASLRKLDDFSELAKKTIGKNGCSLYLNGEIITPEAKNLIRAAKSKLADKLVPDITFDKFDQIFSFDEISRAVICVRCESSLVLNFSFMRLAEHYESACDRFRGGLFTREEFKTWYTDQNNGVFTYYDDWGGFNIPGESFNSFLEAGFSDLLPIEQFLINKIKQASREIQGRFYIIGVGNSEDHTFIEHELAHAFYSLNSEYRAEIDKILLRIPREQQDIIDSLLRSYGYNELVLQDETQAFLLHAPEYFENMAWGKKGLDASVILALHRKISEIFNKYRALS